VVLVAAGALALQDSSAPPSHLADPFALGWMLKDTNGDGIADFVEGKIVVPANPTAAENAAAANLAARLGYGSTGLTLPIVVTDASGAGPKIFIGRAAPVIAGVALEKEEGAVFLTGDNLAVIGADDEGLLAAADAYSSRAPYQWRVPGDRLAALGAIVGVSYAKGKAGVNRAFLSSGGVNALNPPAAPATPAAGANAQQADATGNPPPRLDLAALYTSRGLFT